MNQSKLLPLLTIVFAILGMLFLGIIFIPIAFVCCVIATIMAFRNKDIGYIGLTVLGWILTIIGFFLSPLLLGAIGLTGAS